LRTAVVLFNLGGPDSLDAVEPFLQKLFSDPAIIGLPAFLRLPVARFAARRRAPVAREIYAKLGGASPINAETTKQAEALETALARRGRSIRTFVAMRYWRPLIADTFGEVRRWSPEKIVLLPLYPQYSGTTTASSFAEWERLSRATELGADTVRVCCYPRASGFIDAMAALIQETLTRTKPDVYYRILLSAHGLPKRVVDRGDPYQWQVERTVEAIIARCKTRGLDYSICYQSRVGPLEWIGPATDAEVRRAGAEKTGLIVMPVAFVSEHSETLVELDIEYARLAEESGAPDYIRVPAVRTHPAFINGLAQLVLAAVGSKTPVTCAAGRICPPGRTCGHERVPAHV